MTALKTIAFWAVMAVGLVGPAFLPVSVLAMVMCGFAVVMAGTCAVCATLTVICMIGSALGWDVVG